MQWPKSVVMEGPNGKVVCEAHADWCPIELARAIYGGEMLVFHDITPPKCRCHLKPIQQTNVQ